MNILNKVTLQSLKKNRTRTIVTIIGVMLSVSLITAVTSFIASLQHYLIRGSIEATGDWHVRYYNVDYDFAQSIGAMKDVRKSTLVQNLGYALLDGGINSDKPYVFVMGADSSTFEVLPIRITSGRLPLNSSEIVIPEHVETNGGVTYKAGDKLTLQLGQRSFEGRVLNQTNPYMRTYVDGPDYTVLELFTPEITRTYTVVGICTRPKFEDFNAPGYTLITGIDAGAAGGTNATGGTNAAGNANATGGTGRFDLLVAMKSPARVYDFAKKTAQGHSVEYNRELLRYYGVSTNSNFNTVLYSLATILITLITICSILLIYNSFAISVSERSRQFGMLSSVGATRKQLQRSVLFEGLCIGAFGIPAGILLGLAGIGITLHFIGDIFSSMTSTSATLSLSVSIPALAIAVVLGVLTILVSAYIPARRAMKKSTIDIIRQSDDIKIRAKAVKTSRLAAWLFGLEGTLALKSFKRNRKRYRSTVISLFISVVLFVSASAFGMYLKTASGLTIADFAYDISFHSMQSSYRRSDEELLRLYEKMVKTEGVYLGGYTTILHASSTTAKSKLTDSYLEHMWSGDATDEAVPLYMSIEFIDDESYGRYLQSLGLSPKEYQVENGKLVAVAKISGYLVEEQRVRSFDIFKGKDIALTVTPGFRAEDWIAPSFDLEIKLVEAMPDVFSGSQYPGFTIYAPYSAKHLFSAPEEAFSGLSLFFLSHDPAASASQMEAIIKEAGVSTGYQLFNTAAALQQERNLILVINVFTYGFVILIALITITNVFNTISTSINLRRREFAMLRSVGMGNRSFTRMINFECLFYGLKALLYGLPVAFAVTYLIYRSVLAGVDLGFILPWESIAVSVLGVFLVVFITMLYATQKMKSANVIDMLRDEIA